MVLRAILYIFTLIVALLLGINVNAQTSGETYVSWHPQGNRLAVANDNQVEIIDVSSSNILNSFVNLERQAIAPVWSPSGQFLAIATGGNIELWQYPWDSSNATLVNTFQVTTAPTSLLDLEWSPSGDKLASVVGSAIDIWDTQTYSHITSIVDSFTVMAIEWSQDETFLAIARTNAQITYVDVVTHEVEFTIHLSNQHKSPPDDLVTARTIDLGSTDNLIAIGDEEGNFRILDRNMSNLPFLMGSESHSLEVIHPGSSYIFSVDWNSNDELVAGAGYDGIVWVWDANTLEEITQIPVGTPVYSVSWSPDGTKLAYGSSNGTVEIVDAWSTPSLME